MNALMEVFDNQISTRYIKFTEEDIDWVIANSDAHPSNIHNRWKNRMRDEGWNRGDDHSSVLKTHPYLVPFEELHQSVRIKYHMFRNIVKNIHGEGI